MDFQGVPAGFKEFQGCSWWFQGNPGTLKQIPWAFQKRSESLRECSTGFQWVSRMFQGLSRGGFKGIPGSSSGSHWSFKCVAGGPMGFQGRSRLLQGVSRGIWEFSKGLRGVPGSFRGVPRGIR